jgi:hypothetical protein
MPKGPFQAFEPLPAHRHALTGRQERAVRIRRLSLDLPNQVEANERRTVRPMKPGGIERRLEDRESLAQQTSASMTR